MGRVYPQRARRDESRGRRRLKGHSFHRKGEGEAEGYWCEGRGQSWDDTAGGERESLWLRKKKGWESKEWIEREEGVVMEEVDEGCKRWAERSCNPMRIKIVLDRGSTLMLEEMLQPRGVQPETNGWFVSWDGRRKNEGFIWVSKESSTKTGRKTMLGHTYLGDRKENRTWATTMRKPVLSCFQMRLDVASLHSIWHTHVHTHKIHTCTMKMLSSEVDTNLSWMLECVVGVGGFHTTRSSLLGNFPTANSHSDI